MGDPPPVPSPAGGGGSTGGNGESDVLCTSMLNILANCGFNETYLEQVGVNVTYASSLNITSRLTYWQHILSVHNCSGGQPLATHQPPTTGSNPSYQPTLITYFVTIMVLGLAMNICVIGTIIQVRRLRTVTNIFVLSLALADLLMAVVVIPLQIVELVSPDVVRYYIDAFFPILGVASLLNLCAVTLDRYFTITRPLTYEAKISSTRVTVIIAAIWLISIAQECLRFSIELQGREAEHQTEQISQGEKIFQVVRFVFAFSMPFICVLFVNAHIYIVARGHSRQIDAAIPAHNDGRSSRSFTKKLKTARIIGLLVGTFVFTWLPYFLLTVYEIYNQEIVQTASKTDRPLTRLEIGNTVCSALASSTALFNPLLYGLMRKEVREAMLKCVKCQNINQMDTDGSVTAVSKSRNQDTTTATPGH